MSGYSWRVQPKVWMATRTSAALRSTQVVKKAPTRCPVDAVGVGPQGRAHAPVRPDVPEDDFAAPVAPGKQSPVLRERETADSLVRSDQRHHTTAIRSPQTHRVGERPGRDDAMAE
jgi:hypothetical protein